ncbi:MAG: DUF2905 domain-containing protein [Rhodocyclaceae bacterium]
MPKWILTLAVAVAILGLCVPWLSRHLRLGRLPGDFTFRYRGRNYRFPFSSTLLLSLTLLLVGKLF